LDIILIAEELETNDHYMMLRERRGRRRRTRPNGAERFTINP